MAKAKYKELGIEYKLSNLKALTKEKAIEAKKHILSGILETKNKHQ